MLASAQQTPPSSSSGSRSGNSNRTHKSRDTKDGTEKEAPASDAAREVAKRLGVSVGVRVSAAGNAGSGRARRRVPAPAPVTVPVTVCVNDVSTAVHA